MEVLGLPTKQREQIIWSVNIFGLFIVLSIHLEHLVGSQ